MINYQGIPEATLIHALWHGQKSCAPNTPAFLIDLESSTSGVWLHDVEQDLERYDHGGKIHIDYYRGRALKVKLDVESKTFDEFLYDRDAGQGKAQEIVDRLRVELCPTPIVVGGDA